VAPPQNGEGPGVRAGEGKLLRASQALLVLLLLLAGGLPRAVAAQAPVLSLSAATTVVPVGSAVVVDVIVSGVTDLYGAEIELGFDHTRLQVLDADGVSANGVQVAAGELLQTAYQAENLADNGSGSVRFAASLERPSPAVAGSGSLVRITFSAVAAGSATVSLTGALLANSDGYAMSYTVGQPLTLAIGDVGWVVGRVTLQGRTNQAGTPVYVGSYAGTTDSTGAFRIAAPAGVYDVRTEAPRYLDALRTGVQVQLGHETALSAVKLLGGDANDDGAVNVVDLAIIGRAFGSTPSSSNWDERADINGDSVVNIRDFVLAASNFGKSEPLVWP